MRLSILVGAAGTCFVAGSVLAQTPPSAPQPRAVTRTIYTRNTELFAEWQPLVAGQPARLTARLTHTGDRFRPYTEGTAKLTLTVDGDVVNANADAPERPGVRPEGAEGERPGAQKGPGARSPGPVSFDPVSRGRGRGS